MERTLAQYAVLSNAEMKNELGVANCPSRKIRRLKNERWNDEICEKVNGEQVYRNDKGFIISKEEWENKK